MQVFQFISFERGMKTLSHGYDPDKLAATFPLAKGKTTPESLTVSSSAVK